MSTKFYYEIIEEERKKFDIQDEELKIGACLLLNYNNQKSGKNILHLDYNIPEIRCEYLYRYATINAGLAKKYFQKLGKIKEVKDSLQMNKNIKICSLGGGPGTDILGIVNALKVIGKFHTKVAKASVLDICEGWENFFTVINRGQYHTELIKVDLFDSLPCNVQEIISTADIICMVRFITAIRGDRTYKESFKAVGNLFKPGAIVLYIDSFNEERCTMIEDIFKDIGLETVLGPVHEKYLDWPAIQADKSNEGKSELYKSLFGCVPQIAAKFSAIGCIKTATTSRGIDNVSDRHSISNVCDEWETQSEDSDIFVVASDPDFENDKPKNKTASFLLDKSTQTEITQLIDASVGTVNSEATLNHVGEMSALMEALSDLIDIVERKLKKYPVCQSCYCCNHCHAAV